MFSCLQKHSWGGGRGRRDFYTLISKVFVSLYITGQIFLWIPYSQSFMIDNEGFCRNGGGGTYNPLSVSSFAAKVCSAELGLGMDI